jgi:phospholipid/cholesterol/gamma-HCH transport system substrate-binding protein
MRRSQQDFVVGLVSIVAVGGLCVLLLLFGEFSFLFSRSYEIPVQANAAAGLRAGSQVMLDGVPVGEIREVRIQPEGEWPVRMTLRVWAENRIPSGVEPRLAAGLLGGGSKLDLRRPPPGDGSFIDPTNPPTLTARFTSISDQMEQLLSGAHAWVGDEQLRNDFKGAVRQANELVEQATEAARLLNVAMNRVNSGEGTVGRLLNDPELYRNLSDAAERLSLTLKDLQLLVRKVKDEGLDVKF